ncbi:MAG: DMT family transporter [Pseudomonadota bacterium]|nr:DMT family transporter [Pseudomonadota bacterium]
METWVLITVVAAFFQNVRSTLQKYLKGRIGTTGATFVRFGFGLPFAYLFLATLYFGTEYSLPVFHARFATWILLAALSQIAAQALLIHLFSYRNFAVGTAYSRTEPAQAALFGLVFLSETVSGLVLLAIAISVGGVMLISIAGNELRAGNLITSLLSRNVAIGLCSGTFFGISAVSYRGAALSLGGPNFLMQGAATLCAAITFQTVIMLLYSAVRDPAELPRILRVWKPALAVGFVGATASFGWFTAMTLEKAAVVKAVAQIEMLFAFASTVLIFREPFNRLEVTGCVAIVGGILLLLLT